MPFTPVIVLGTALLGAAAPTPSPRPVEIRDLVREVGISDPHVSPDGTRVAYVETRQNVDEDKALTEIMLLDLQTLTTRPFTVGRKAAAAPAWSPDGTTLGFLAPDKDNHLQVYLAPLGGGDAQALTHTKKSVSQFAFRPDGKAVAYAVEDDDPEKKGEDKFNKTFRVAHGDFTLQSEALPTHLWVADIGSGETHRVTSGSWSLPTSLPPGPPASPVQWSADGRSLLIVRQETPYTGDQDKSRIQVVDALSGAVRDLTGATRLEGYPRLSPDGRTVAYWGNRDGQMYNMQDVWLAPFSGGRGVDLSAAQLDKNLFGTLWARDSQSLLVGGHVDTTVGLWRLALNGTAKRLDLGPLVPSNFFWMSYDETPSGDLIVAAATKTHPVELYRVRAGEPPVALTHVNDWSGQLSLADATTVTWKGPTGRTLNGVLTYPLGYQAGKRYPLVLVVHGGPSFASTEEFNRLSQLLAARGYLVFEPNYRGSDNLDGAFYAAIYRDAGQGPGEDVMSGVHKLQADGLVDPARMAVTGWSYGGFMTVWLAGHYPVWKAAVAGAAVTDWRLMYDLSDGNLTQVAQTGISPYVKGGAAENERQSPGTWQTRITAPTLIMTDLGDFRVPPAQSFSLFRALEDNHVEVEFEAIPTGGHYPDDPVQAMDVERRWVDWVDAHLK